jgi:hypothetical protein
MYDMKEIIVKFIINLRDEWTFCCVSRLRKLINYRALEFVGVSWFIVLYFLLFKLIHLIWLLNAFEFLKCRGSNPEKRIRCTLRF